MDRSLPGPLMLLVALLQGIALFVLYRAVNMERWPSNEPVWLTAIAAQLITLPLFFLLLVDAENQKKTLLYLVPFATVATLTAAYAGFQLEPVEMIRDNDLLVPFILSFALVGFKSVMYAQAHMRHGNINYPELFHYSWRNFLTVALACLFVLLFIGILQLWGALFEVIDITFFSDLFEEQWFLIPAATVAFAFAVIIFRSLSGIIDSITKLLQALIKFLLPLTCGVALIFFIALLLSGVSPLWETGPGSGLILGLQTLILFFTNAVYQADSNYRPYPLFIHRMIYAGICVLPAYSLIVFYGLLLRINQYGFTFQRCWALLLAVLLFIFAIDYLWGIIRQQDHWLSWLARANVRLGIVVTVILVLVNTPLLDFRRISANSQYQRFVNGEITAQALDLNYLRFSLGRQGYLTLEKFKADYGEQFPRIAERIDVLYAEPLLATEMTADTLSERLIIWPDGESLPAAALDAIRSSLSTPRGIDQPAAYYAVLVDLNGDTVDEILLIQEYAILPTFYTLWHQTGNGWQRRNLTPAVDRTGQDLDLVLEMDEVEVIDPQWRSLRLGDITLQVTPDPAGNRIQALEFAPPVR